MGTTKKISGKTMGYVILIGLVIVSWVIFKILTPHNFGSFSNMLNYFQASLIATVGAVGFYFVMVMGMFDFSIGANIMLSAIVGCVLATKFNLGYFGLIVGGILTGTIVGLLNGIFYVKLRIPLKSELILMQLVVMSSLPRTWVLMLINTRYLHSS